MATDYAALQARIADELNRSDLSSQIKLEILSAIKHYETQRFWFNEGRATASTVASQANLAVPDDLVEIQRLDVTSNNTVIPVARRDWRHFENVGGADANLATGLPAVYSYKADQLWFFPIPDAAYTLTLTYVKKLAALSADTDENEWTDDGEELIRSRAAQAVRIRYLRDPTAIQEQSAFVMRGEPYLSGFEKSAHRTLLDQSKKRLQIGRLTVDMPGTHDRFSILTG